MSQHNYALASNQEGRIELALSAYRTGQFQSFRRAAAAFNVPSLTLLNRYSGIAYLPDRRNGRQKLTATEEQTIVRYILDLDSRGFPPRLCKVADIADKLLSMQSRELVAKN
jgi:hypothetical protein